MAKLERPEALAALDAILDASDGVMVARGDLGVELPFERVPLLQKQIIERAALRGKWCVVATQMLGSMVVARRPTRAEASDVVNAVLDGTDAVMMSEETAVGENPELAVEAMAALTRAGEEPRAMAHALHVLDPDIVSFASAAAGAAVSAAERLRARAIVTLAGSGSDHARGVEVAAAPADRRDELVDADAQPPERAARRDAARGRQPHRRRSAAARRRPLSAARGLGAAGRTGRGRGRDAARHRQRDQHDPVSPRARRRLIDCSQVDRGARCRLARP